MATHDNSSDIELDNYSKLTEPKLTGLDSAETHAAETITAAGGFGFVAWMLEKLTSYTSKTTPKAGP